MKKEIRDAARPQLVDDRAFRMPTMKAINRYHRRLPDTAPVAVSTFSGMGGASIGMKMAGYKVVWANEFVPIAAETYERNHKDTFLSRKDIRKVTADYVRRKAGIGNREIDLLEGSPPCKAFSSIRGKMLGKKLGDVELYEAGIHQRLDDLFSEFVRLLNELQPRAFTAENVEGLLRKTNSNHFAMIFNALAACGYNVRASVLDGAWLGVAQQRRRLILVGTRKDLDVQPVFPKPLQFQCRVQDVLPKIDEFKFDNYFIPPDRPFSCITASDHSISPTAEFSAGGFVKDGKRHIFRGKDVDFRKLTIDELKVLSSVPTDFWLPERFNDAWTRLGRIRLPAEVYLTVKNLKRITRKKP